MHFINISLYIDFIEEGSGDESEEGGEGGGFGGGPKPMLPYSSMFVFGPTNP